MRGARKGASFVKVRATAVTDARNVPDFDRRENPASGRVATMTERRQGNGARLTDDLARAVDATLAAAEVRA
jgi:hypothetical protein